MRSEWPTRPLGELTVNLDTQRKPVKESERISGPYPYYGASGVVDYVDGYLFDGEYLLIAEDGENLRTRNTPVAFRAVGKFWVNNHAHIVQGNALASTRFLEYAILAADISPYLTGAVMPKLTQSNLKKLVVSCPPCDVQDAIVGVLGALDDRIDLLHQANATLESIAQTLFKSWFIDFDPVRAKAEGREPEGMDAATAALFPTEFEESALGPIPKGWRSVMVGEFFALTMGQSPPGETYNEAGDGVPFFQGRADFGFRFPTVRVYCTAPTRLANTGDVLISVRAPVGDVNVALENCAIGRGVAAVTLDSSPSFALYSMKALRDRFAEYESHGTVFGSINKKQFEALPCVFPGNQVLAAFASIAGPLDERILMNELQLRSLARLRDTLLPRLISGKVRIPATQEEGEGALT
ncbi:type I restriction-modification system, S subunit [Burkholderiales bacterium GJ-E10]|nr:type I restriction-modification system, S subunit [Burkholderiales bacterium GJ-E10]